MQDQVWHVSLPYDHCWVEQLIQVVHDYILNGGAQLSNALVWVILIKTQYFVVDLVEC